MDSGSIVPRMDRFESVVSAVRDAASAWKDCPRWVEARNSASIFQLDLQATRGKEEVQHSAAWWWC